MLLLLHQMDRVGNEELLLYQPPARLRLLSSFLRCITSLRLFSFVNLMSLRCCRRTFLFKAGRSRKGGGRGRLRGRGRRGGRGCFSLRIVSYGVTSLRCFSSPIGFLSHLLHLLLSTWTRQLVLRLTSNGCRPFLLILTGCSSVVPPMRGSCCFLAPVLTLFSSPLVVLQLVFQQVEAVGRKLPLEVGLAADSHLPQSSVARRSVLELAGLDKRFVAYVVTYKILDLDG
mmetsp:Transcript_31308/g.100410  ORF Transcript_31308/g.100410 Transcript_31308/m.100410 type:complete len:229 (-) Transcript_31308:2004-2690(-)